MWRPDARHRRVRGGAAVRRDRHGDGDGSLSGDVEWLERPGDERIVADAVGEFLSLSDDLRPVYDAADADPAFAPVVEDLWGYHHVRFPTPFAAALWAVLARRTPRGLGRDSGDSPAPAGESLTARAARSV